MPDKKPEKKPEKKKVKKVVKRKPSNTSLGAESGRRSATPTPPVKLPPPPTKGSCVILNCIDRSNRKVLDDTEVLENLWGCMGYKPNIFLNLLSKSVAKIVADNISERMADRRETPKCLIIAIQVEEKDGEMVDRHGNALDLKEMCAYLNKTPGLEPIPKMLYLHVYKMEDGSKKTVSQRIKSFTKRPFSVPNVKNLLVYHYAEIQGLPKDKEQKTMAVILREVFLGHRGHGLINVVQTLVQVMRMLPRPKVGPYHWKGPVCTWSLFKPLMLERK